MSKKSVYEIITEKIVSQLERGNIPWQRPWETERPRNISGREYKGINLLLLSFSPFSCPIWATFKQVKEKGGQIKKGEKSSIVVFFKKETKLVPPEGMSLEELEDLIKAGEVDPADYEKEFWLLRYYRIFNLEQTTLEFEKYWQPEVTNDLKPVEKAELIIKHMPDPPQIQHDGGNRAYYDVEEDAIHLPLLSRFKNEEGYYSTLFHELVHSTGHEKRLNRKTLTATAPFGSKTYSQEELVAELGSAFLCAESGISVKIENSAAYIQSWLEVLRNDKKMIVIASSQAEKALDYIMKKRS